MGILPKHVVKLDHWEKISGTAQYVDDLQLPGMLYGKLLRSTQAKARIKALHLPPLPAGYTLITAEDVPGKNAVAMVDLDTPIFADGRVEYISEPILMVVGPTLAGVVALLQQIEVVYEPENPVLDVHQGARVFYEYHYHKGEPEQAFAEADQVVEETFQTGYQEQAYLECQGMLAAYDGKVVTVRGSMQCPYYLHTAVKLALGITDDRKINIVYEYTGGSFGGKEDYPSVLACQTAVAAYKLQRPVKVVLDRREDIATTSKRHPAEITYKTALKEGRITGMQVELLYNAGAYKTLSMVVLQRGVLGASGVYTIANLQVWGRAVQTNTVPNGAFRGFGGPQIFFAIEMHLEHLARKLGQEPLAFKRRYLARQGDATSTNGCYHDPIVLPELIAKVCALSGYEQKYPAYRGRQSGRYRKGIGLALVYHGCGFTGNGERDLIKAKLRLQKFADDSVEILAANIDMGQGVKTTFTEIAQVVLGLPAEKIIFANPATLRVPNSGPTVASRSINIVGKLLERACVRLKKQWRPGEVQVVEENYQHPAHLLPFTIEPEAQGDAYPAYSWSANVVEVAVDTLTGQVELKGAWGAYDIGVPIDEAIAKGQMEGGLLQSLGYAGMEQMTTTAGRLRNDSFSDYLIPTAADVPSLQIAFVNNPYPYGPFGAKGAGELPAVGAAPAYVAALECAVGKAFYCIPVTMEAILTALEGEGHE